MLACFILTALVYRPSEPYSGLSLAALIILTITPLASYEVSFQLSFAATIGILVVLPLTKKIQHKYKLITSLFLNSLLISATTLLFTAPLTIYHFYTLTPITLFTNLLAIPLLMVIISFSLVAITISFLYLPLAQIISQIILIATLSLEYLAKLATSIPGARIWLWPPSASWVIFFYLNCGLLLVFRKYRIINYFFFILLVGLYFSYKPNKPPDSQLRATFLALKLGEATLIETGHKLKVLIDTGTKQEFFQRVKPYLAKHGINKLDALILSHADADHAGGANACMTFFRVEELISTGLTSSYHKNFSKIAQTAKKKNTKCTTLRQGYTCSLSNNLVIKTIWPPPGKIPSNNDYSLVIQIIHPTATLFFSGDCPSAIEKQWQLNSNIDLFKAAHHGAKNSNSTNLLIQIRPKITIVTPGTRNPYGFPHSETSQRLTRFSEVVLNTKKHGAIQIYFEQDNNITWKTWQ